MQVFTLEHLIKIERVASRAVNAAKAFAEGTDRQMLEDLTTLISEVRHAASCTQEGEVVIADLWVTQEARTDALRVANERKVKEAADKAFDLWSRFGEESTAAADKLAATHNVDRFAVRDVLSDLIQAYFKKNGL